VIRRSVAPSRRSRTVVTVAGAVVGMLLPGCAPPRGPALPPLPAPAFAADSARARQIARGVVHRSYYVARGPWAIEVLDVDRAACWTPVAVKAGGAAVGRARTSSLVAALAASEAAEGRLVAGGVNADFFSFSPPGVPVGAHVHRGRVVAGPVARPVFATRSTGAPWIGTLGARGRAIVAGDTLPITAWNRAPADGVALFDAAWGARTDSATGAVEVVAGAGRPAPVRGVDTSPAGVAIPDRGVVLAAGAAAPPASREQLGALRAGRDSVSAQVTLAPFHPREAVGGFPVLLAGGAVAEQLDSAGGPKFGPVRHPRTAVGIGAGGRRLLLVTVDGRQPSYSAGMTLAELAGVMRELGATDALNLDGGGSTTMVVAAGPGGVRVANRPSDAAGERPVANALVITRGCDTAVDAVDAGDRATHSGR